MEINLINIIQSLPNLTLSIIIFISALGIYFLFFRFNSRTVLNAPTVLTSIGIFGTFFGIALGLSDFNTEDIQGSVPTLIAGLKTAFWSSVVGVFFALAIKLRHLYEITTSKLSEASHGATIDDIVNQLKDVNTALIGEEESTLLSQIKLMRQDSNDRLDGLRKAMKDFINDMAENNSKALIEALEEVIKDFNTKINEQFGDNFKQLNEAVGKILDWQELYRTQMEEMIIQQKTTSDLMVKATSNYEEIVQHSNTFSEVSQDLSKTLESLDLQQKNIYESVKFLGEIIDSAKTGLPTIETKISELVKQVTDGAEQNTKIMQEAISSSAQNIDNLMNQTNTEFNKHIGEISEKTKQQVNELDRAMAEELTKALESFGKQLSALSEKFVSDYTPLTEKLRNILSIAKNV